MPLNNPFANPAFGMAALTAAINLLPNRYGRLEELGLFNPRPVRTRTVVVEEKAGVLTLLPSRPVDSPGTVGIRGKRTLRSFVIPHIPHDDVVLPEEVQGLRAFGSESEFASIAAVLAEHLDSMRAKHAATLEFLRIGALKGIVVDADGSELVNLYTYVFMQEYQPVLGGPMPRPLAFFDEHADRHIDELVRIQFTQNMKSVERYYRWLSRRYAGQFGRLHPRLVDTIFRYNKRDSRGRYVETLAGTRPLPSGIVTPTPLSRRREQRNTSRPAWIDGKLP